MNPKLIIRVLLHGGDIEVHIVSTRVKTERGRRRSIEYWMEQTAELYPDYRRMEAHWEDRV